MGKFSFAPISNGNTKLTVREANRKELKLVDGDNHVSVQASNRCLSDDGIIE